MKEEQAETVGWWSHMWDVLAFLVGIGLAWMLEWQTRDLVWSLWLSSLLTGYLCLLGSVAPFAFLGLLAAFDPEGTASDKVKYVGIVAVGILFFLGFFSVHFGGFHAVHAVFLGQFFPLPDNYEVPFTFWPPTVLRFAFELVPLYGFFIVAVLMSQRDRLILRPLHNIRVIWRARQEHKAGGEEELDFKGFMKDSDLMAGPYKNVIRMHLLIFFFAFVHFLKVDSFLVFAVVYAVYFFPWSVFGKGKNPGKEMKS